MTSEEFLKKARLKLSTDPYSRMTKSTKKVFDQDDCLIDTHCHVFDRKCIKINYLLLRLALSKFRTVISQYALSPAGKLKARGRVSVFQQPDPVEQIYEWLASDTYAKGLVDDDTDEDWRQTEELLEEMEAQQSSLKMTALGRVAVRDVLAAVRVLMKGSMEKVYQLYLDRHALTVVSEYSDQPFVSCVLMMDLEQGWGKRTKKRYDEQVEELNHIAEKYEVLPFLALDPRRKDLYEIFLKAFCEKDSHFFGVKTYPSFGYTPSASQLYPIFQLCEEFKIPVTTHCGGAMISTFNDPVFVERCSSATSCSTHNVPGTRKQIASILNEPSEWRNVLSMFPNLKVNLAHFGGDFVWDAYSQGIVGPRITDIHQLMTQYKGVYADFAFNIEDANLDAALVSGMNTYPIFQERCMFGTDYWVVLPFAELATASARFLNNVGSMKKQLVTTNPKDFLLK